MEKYNKLIQDSKSDNIKTLLKTYSELHMINQIMPIMDKYMVAMCQETKSLRPLKLSQEVYFQDSITYN